jgi:hypothetical protein
LVSKLLFSCSSFSIVTLPGFTLLIIVNIIIYKKLFSKKSYLFSAKPVLMFRYSLVKASIWLQGKNMFRFSDYLGKSLFQHWCLYKKFRSRVSLNSTPFSLHFLV